MRLTEKNSGKWDNKYHLISSLFSENTLKAIDKLGQLEDIEEELGIDLLTLIKASRDGIYYNAGINAETKKMSIYECKPLLQFASKALVMVDSVCKGEFYYFYFKDYGKTWALTKEELL